MLEFTSEELNSTLRYEVIWVGGELKDSDVYQIYQEATVTNARIVKTPPTLVEWSLSPSSVRETGRAIRSNLFIYSLNYNSYILY